MLFMCATNRYDSTKVNETCALKRPTFGSYKDEKSDDLKAEHERNKINMLTYLQA